MKFNTQVRQFRWELISNKIPYPAHKHNVCRRVRAVSICTLLVLLASIWSFGSQVIQFANLTKIEYVSAGTGGMRNVGSGTINVVGIPEGATIKFAYLYWHGPTNSADSNVNANVMFSGVPITGTNIGLSGDNNWGFQNTQAYRADVTSLVSGNGSYNLTNFGSSTSADSANTNGASLIIFYDDHIPANYRDVILLNGNDSNGNGLNCPLAPPGQGDFDPAGWNATVSGIHYNGGTANLQLHVADGQTYNDDALVLNGVIDPPLVAAGTIFQGNSVPGASFVAGNLGDPGVGNLWDIETFPVPPNYFSVDGTTTLTLTTGVLNDCLSLVATVFDVPAGTTAPSQTSQPQPVTAGQSNVIQFVSTDGQLVQHNLTWPSDLTYQNGVTMPQLVSTNTVLSNNGGIQPFLANTPWAVGLLMEHQGDNQVANGSGFGSLYSDKCYQKGSDPSTATLSNCPVGKNPTDLVNFADIFDFPLGGKVDIAPGTTVSLVHHPGTRVADLSPTIDWVPVLTGTSNPVCMQVQLSGFSCDLEDGLTYDPATMPPILPGGAPGGVSGDQTTVGGGLKGRGVLGSLYNVPMLTTQVSVNSTKVNTPGVQGNVVHWFNSGTLNLDFLVSPASTTNPTNGWFAAPVNNLAYVLYNSNSTEPALPNPPNCANPPSANCVVKAGSALPGVFVASTAPNVEFVDSASTSGDGVYTLAWSAKDTVNIGERNIQLQHAANAVCPNPFGLTPAPTPPCYSTTLFSEQIGIDTVPPTITPSFSAAGPYSPNQIVTVTFNCADNPGGSGLASCTAPFTLITSAAGTFPIVGTAKDVAGNSTTVNSQYTVVNVPADLDIVVLAPLSVYNSKNLTYGIAAVNLGPNPASGVTVTVPLPAGTILVKAKFAVETCTIAGGCPVPTAGIDCPQVGNSVVCNVGSLNLLKKGTGLGIGIQVYVPAALKGKTLTESATITSSNSDSRPSNNTSTAHTIVK